MTTYDNGRIGNYAGAKAEPWEDYLRQLAHLKFVQNLAFEALEAFPRAEAILEDGNNIDVFKSLFKRHFEFCQYYNGSQLAEGHRWEMLQGHMGGRYGKIAAAMSELNRMLLEAHEPVEYTEKGRTRIRRLYELAYPDCASDPEQPVKISIRISDLAKNVFDPQSGNFKADCEPSRATLHLEVYRAIIGRASSDVFDTLSLLAHSRADGWENSGMSSSCPACPGKPRKK